MAEEDVDSEKLKGEKKKTLLPDNLQTTFTLCGLKSFLKCFFSTLKHSLYLFILSIILTSHST